MVAGTASYYRVGQAIEHALESGGLSLAFQQLVRIPLAQSGKTLGGAAEPRWPALVLASSAAASGDEHAAVTVAAAVEMFMAAPDVLDDIQDGDQSALVSEIGVPQALNVSSALVMLAQRAILQMSSDGVSPSRVNLMVSALVQAGLEATGGQYEDLSAEGRKDVSLAGALAITRAKAGSLVAGACRLGALTGTDDEDILSLYGAWARHYGTMVQLVNDYHDVTDTNVKSDRVRAKRTLPLVFAEGDDQESLATNGALHFTWVVFELERVAARNILSTLESRGQRIESLVALMGS